MLSRAMEKQPDRRQQSIEEFGIEVAEAFKRDAIRLNYLKNRKDELSSEQGIPTFTYPRGVGCTCCSGGDSSEAESFTK